MLASQGADLYKVQDCLDEIESLVRLIGAGWRPEPPQAVFDEKVEEAQQLLAQATQRDARAAREGYDKQLDAICTEAKKSLAAQNTAVWKDSYNKLVALCDRLHRVAQPREGGGSDRQDPAATLLSLARELDALEKWAKEQGRYPKHKNRFADLAADLKGIDPKASDAMNQIRDWYFTNFTKFADLKQRLEAPEQKKGIVGLTDPNARL